MSWINDRSESESKLFKEILFKFERVVLQALANSVREAIPVLGLCAMLGGSCSVTSNRESGDGRYDLHLVKA